MPRPYRCTIQRLGQLGTACIGLAKDGADDQRAGATGAASERRAVLRWSLAEDRSGFMDKPGGIIEEDLHCRLPPRGLFPLAPQLSKITEEEAQSWWHAHRGMRQWMLRKKR